MNRASRRWRGAQRGQAIPLIAVMGVLLLGVTALAADLSVNTHFRRNLQNVTDSASLAGVSRLQSAPVTQANRTQGVIDALSLMYDRLSFPITGSSAATFISNLVNAGSCTGSGMSCTVNCPSSGSSCSVTLHSGQYTMLADSPPTGSSNPAYNGQQQYLEAKVTQASANGFGAVIGFGSGTEAGHSVAYHSPSNAHFNFALYAQQYVQDGNADEIITGNVYAAQYLAPQSNGQATICVQGSIVLGAPQHPNEPSGYDTQATVTPLPSTARSVYLVNGVAGAGSTTCATATQGNALGGYVAQTNGEGCSVSGVTMPAKSYVDDAGFSQTVPAGVTLGITRACVANPGIGPPTLISPTLLPDSSVPTYDCSAGNTGLDAASGKYQPGLYTCPLTVDHALAPGLYQLEHLHGSTSPDVSMGQAVAGSCTSTEIANGFQTCLDGVTFYGRLNGQGEAPSISVGGKVSVNQVPYCPSPRTSIGDCVSPIYAPIGVALALNVSKNGTLYALQGSVYMPTGSAYIDTNARVQILGQALVTQWNDQSGFHPDPSITYNEGLVGSLPEQMRLVD
jgi:hypothetical protein